MNKRKETDSISTESNTKQYKMTSDSSREPIIIDSSNSCSNQEYAEINLTKKTPQQQQQLNEWLLTFSLWSHNERTTALDSLMKSGICDNSQFRHLLSLIEPMLQRDFISFLPKELSLYVLSFLDPSDLLSAAQTCRYWRILCEDNLLWREKCREEGLLNDNECFADFLRNRLSASTNVTCSNFSPISDESSSQTSSGRSGPNDANLAVQNQENFIKSEYKQAFLTHKSIEFNWRYGQLIYNFELDQPAINNNNIQVENQPPAAAAAVPPAPAPAADINVQSTSSNKCQAASLPKNSKPRRLKDILHLKGHEDHVITCLQFNPASNIIVSGSDDNTLKVWCSTTGRCLRTLNGHTGGVWSSQLSPENIVISGSTDRTLRVWNALDGCCLHVLYGHTSTVRCMALNGRYVVSGSRDATLRVWDIETGVCDHVLVGHLAAVRCVQFNGTLCVSGAYDYLVKIWDVASETCLHTLEGHTNRVYSLQFDGIHIVSGSLDTSIRVWSAETGRLKHTLVGHQSLTSGMQLRSNILVSGNADSTVKVWDINTGQCLQTLSGNNKHQSAVTCLQFNSNFVITSSDDGTVKLWDLKTGDFIRNLVSLPSGGSGGVVWRIRASNTKLVCAVGSRNGTEETKLLVLDFDVLSSFPSCEPAQSMACEFFVNSPSQNVLPPFDSTESLPSSTNAPNGFPQLGHCAKFLSTDFRGETKKSLPGSIGSIGSTSFATEASCVPTSVIVLTSLASSSSATSCFHKGTGQASVSAIESLSSKTTTNVARFSLKQADIVLLAEEVNEEMVDKETKGGSDSQPMEDDS